MTYDPATFTTQAIAEVAKHDARVPEQRAGSERARGWFSDIDRDEPGEYRWQPCLETGTGHIPHFEVWFRTEAECDEWIGANVLGVGTLADHRGREAG